MFVVVAITSISELTYITQELMHSLPGASCQQRQRRGHSVNSHAQGQTTQTHTPSASSITSSAGGTGVGGPAQTSQLKEHHHVMRQLPEFGFAKHMPDTLNRVVTEISGAPFVTRLVAQAAAAAAKRKADQGADHQGQSAVDVNELLTVQPKKRQRRAAAPKSRRGTTAKAAAQPADVDVEIQDGDVAMAASDDAASRPRWWVDDVFSCLAHAAGGAQSDIMVSSPEFAYF